MLSGSESSCRTPELWADEDEDIEVDDAVSDVSCDKSATGKHAGQGEHHITVVSTLHTLPQKSDVLLVFLQYTVYINILTIYKKYTLMNHI